MTLLDTEQSYVESLRTLMQVTRQRLGTWHPKPRHGMPVPCLSLSLGPQVGPPAVGALPALMRHGMDLGRVAVGMLGTAGLEVGAVWQ